MKYVKAPSVRRCGEGTDWRSEERGGIFFFFRPAFCLLIVFKSTVIWPLKKERQSSNYLLSDTSEPYLLCTLTALCDTDLGRAGRKLKRCHRQPRSPPHAERLNCDSLTKELGFPAHRQKVMRAGKRPTPLDRRWAKKGEEEALPKRKGLDFMGFLPPGYHPHSA